MEHGLKPCKKQKILFEEHEQRTTTAFTKPDHANRPIWACEDGRIFLETFSPFYKQASDFLTLIAEPYSRTESLHEYNLTPHSLYAAVSVGLQTDTIVSVLNKLAKTQLPNEILDFVRASTANYGKVKLVLKKNRYLVESSFPEVLERLSSDHVIARARVLTGTNEFEIDPAHVENVKQRCLPDALNFPLLEEYDFGNDTVNPNVKMELKPRAQLRPYQEKCLSRMIGNGRARSGIIVLPCGAGKSLVGVSASDMKT